VVPPRLGSLILNKKPAGVATGIKEASLTRFEDDNLKTSNEIAYPRCPDNGGSSGTGYLYILLYFRPATLRSIQRCRTHGTLTYTRSLGRRFSVYSSSSLFLVYLVGAIISNNFVLSRVMIKYYCRNDNL